MSRFDFSSFLFVPLLLIFLKQAQAIIGGEEVTNGGFSYTVALWRDGKVICSGSIIGKDTVVTAAHCVYDEKDSQFTMSPLQVIANTSDYNIIGPTAVVADVDTISIPKKYLISVKGTAKIGDIAVLKLLQELDLTYSSGITKLFLPEDDHYTSFDTEKILHFTGYGWDWYRTKPDLNRPRSIIKEGGSSGKLRVAPIRITNIHDCRYVFDLKFESSKHECARMDNISPDNGVTYGDDGGPLVHDRDTLYGVLSMYNTKTSNTVMPAVYTKVSTFQKFILSVKQDKKNPSLVKIKLLRSDGRK